MTDHNYRICDVVSENNYVLYKGLFHGFYARSEVLPPSPLRGGHAGGVAADVVALVEDANGVCRPIPAHRINFIDGLANEILSNKEKEVSENG